MSAGKYNITADQGSTFKLDFTVTTDGAGWDFTSYTGRMQVRSSVGAATTLLSLTSDDEITLGNDGSVAIVVDADTMAGVVAGRFVYDFEVESSGGEVTRILEGKFTVKAEVTR
jgi:hypothetical protein